MWILIIEDNILQIPEINENTRYWLVRANGGKYYEDFKNSSTISIHDNELSLDMFKSDFLLTNVKTIEYYKQKIASIKWDDSRQKITLLAKKMFLFIEEMKNGDIVIVPSIHSNYFLIGIITSDVYELSEEQIKENKIQKEISNIHISLNRKRRKVIWFNEISRDFLNPKLFYMLNMHQTIIEIIEEAEYIDPLISRVYFKDSGLHFSLRVNARQNINISSWNALFGLVGKVEDKIDKEKISVKTNVQSPGDIQVIIENINNFLDFLNENKLIIILFLGVFSEIKFKDISFKGLLPTVFDYKKNKLENRSKELSNMRAEIELEEFKKDGKVRELERELKIKELQESIADFDISINPTLQVISSESQKQMDLKEKSDEEQL